MVTMLKNFKIKKKKIELNNSSLLKKI